MKTDLKPGCVRVFICEECGEAFLGSVNAFDEGYHVRRYDGCDHDCGPITERILADPDVVRRETIEELLSPTQRAVLDLQQEHRQKRTWHHRPEAYWMMRLIEEVGELASSIAGRHEHAPDLELQEIASICLSWLERREIKAICADAVRALADEPRETEPNGGG